jgi:hypothetical protein
MIPVDITCAQCGWRNEATARMCGGCGQPLRQPLESGATVAIPGEWAADPQAGNTTPADAPYGFAPTMAAPTPAAYTPPGAANQAHAYEAAPSIWPGAGSPGQQAGARPATNTKRNPWRAPIILLVVLCVLLAATLGAWALILRPAVHSTVDTQLRSALDSAIEQAAPSGVPLPPNTPLTITIPASALNANISSELGSVPVQNVQVHFRGSGYVRAGYTFLGRDGTITTQLVPLADGRVQAQNTSVTGLLKAVESADEMSAAFNEALGRLPPQYHVTQITTANDSVFIHVTVTGP